MTTKVSAPKAGTIVDFVSGGTSDITGLKGTHWAALVVREVEAPKDMQADYEGKTLLNLQVITDRGMATCQMVPYSSKNEDYSWNKGAPKAADAETLHAAARESHDDGDEDTKKDKLEGEEPKNPGTPDGITTNEAIKTDGKPVENPPPNALGPNAGSGAAPSTRPAINVTHRS